MTVEVVKDITATGEIVLLDTTIPANGTLHCFMSNLKFQRNENVYE